MWTVTTFSMTFARKGILALTDISNKELNFLCEIHLFMPSFEDILLFRLHWKVSIHWDGIVGKVEEENFQRLEIIILKLSEASYETLFRYQNDIEYLLADNEVESCEEDSEQDFEDDSRVDVVFGGMLLCTASGRPVIHPNRMDLQHITSTKCFSFFNIFPIASFTRHWIDWEFKFLYYIHCSACNTLDARNIGKISCAHC